MYGIRITEEPDWSVDTELLPRETPPETLWFCTEHGVSGQTPRFVYLGDRPCVMLFEAPKEEQIPEGFQQPIIFYRFSTEDMGSRYYRIDGQWLVENTFCPNAPDAWLNQVISRGGDDCVCLRWVEKEWFEKVRRICSEWDMPLEIRSNALSGYKAVEYAWYRGGIPHNRAIFLVSMLSEDDYFFSDGARFYYAHIMNRWEWDSWIDEPRWNTYKCVEDLLIRHCYGNRSLVPLDYLPLAFSSFIRHHLPTMDFAWFMYAKEDAYSAAVFLIARYGEFRGHPRDVKALELLVGTGEADPNARKVRLIAGEQSEIFAWLVDREHQAGIVQTARQMLEEYESRAGS